MLGVHAALGIGQGAASAATEPWSPQSQLFQLNYRFASITLLFAAAGIALGLFGVSFFRRRRPALQGRSGQVERHSIGHRVAHWLNALGFIAATLSGAMLLKWLPNPLDLTLVYTVHYLGAGAILLGMGGTAVHALTTGASQRHRLIPRGETVRWALTGLLSYAGLVGDQGILGFKGLQWPASLRKSIEDSLGFQGFPAEQKYLASQRVLSYPFWVLVSLAVVSTGLLKAVRYAYPTPNAIVLWATRIHDWAFYGTLVMLFVHVAAVVLVRTNWPLLRSMFTGKVPLQYVRAVHGRWYEELVREQEGKERTAGPRPLPRPNPGGEGPGR